MCLHCIFFNFSHLFYRSASGGNFWHLHSRQKTEVSKSPPLSSLKPKQPLGTSHTHFNDGAVLTPFRHHSNGGYLTSRSTNQNRPVMQQFSTPAEIHENRSSASNAFKPNFQSNQVPADSIAVSRALANVSRDKESVLRLLASYDFNFSQRTNGKQHDFNVNDIKEPTHRGGVRIRSPFGTQNGAAPRPTPSTSLSGFHDNGLAFSGDRLPVQHGKLIAQSQAVAVQKIYGGRNNSTSNSLNRHLFNDTSGNNNGRIVTNNAFALVNPKSLIIW